MLKTKDCPIFVDVDDTLVRSFGNKRIPITSVIEHVRSLHKEGFPLYCWSRGGADYAKRSAEELAIVDCFIAFLPKPKIMIDDQSLDKWSFVTEIHPNECSSKELKDYLE